MSDGLTKREVEHIISILKERATNELTYKADGRTGKEASYLYNAFLDAANILKEELDHKKLVKV